MTIIQFIHCAKCNKKFLEGEFFNNHICNPILMIDGKEYFYCKNCDKRIREDYFSGHPCELMKT